MKEPNYLEGKTGYVNHEDLILPKSTSKAIEKEEKAIIDHKLIISGKVRDVCCQLNMMALQFPGMTIREMLDKYGVTEMVLQ